MILDRRNPNTIFFRNGKIQLINAVVFAGVFSLLVLLGYVYNSVSQVPITIKNLNEQVWREQARRELNNLKVQLIQDIQDGTVDAFSDESLQLWASKRLTNVRNGGDTSDAFMIQLSTGKFIWDGSPDCSKKDFTTKGRFIKDEIVNQQKAKEYLKQKDLILYEKDIITANDLLKLEKTNPEIIKYFRENKIIIHENYEIAEKMYYEMEQGYDTNSSSHRWWQFDNSRELLEWIIVPAQRVGFNEQSNTIGGVKNKNYRAVLIQLGTQEDEINSQYKEISTNVNSIKFIFVGIGILLMMLASLFMINILFLQEECNHCPLRKSE